MQTLIQVGVVDRFGMELLFDPFFQAELADFFDVSGTRPVGEAIHGVQNGFVFGEFGDGELAFELFVESDVFGGAPRWDTCWIERWTGRHLLRGRVGRR